MTMEYSKPPYNKVNFVHRISWEYNLVLALKYLALYHLIGMLIGFLMVFLGFGLSVFSFTTFTNIIFFDGVVGIALAYISGKMQEKLADRGYVFASQNPLVFALLHFIIFFSLFSLLSLTLIDVFSWDAPISSGLVLISAAGAAVQTLDLYFFLRFQKRYERLAFKIWKTVFMVALGLYFLSAAVSMSYVSAEKIPLSEVNPLRALLITAFLGISLACGLKLYQVDKRREYYSHVYGETPIRFEIYNRFDESFYFDEESP
ncbi:MAG: membrane protein of unknown function [Promethearchaeota archaeon]|nr:MAG: membrane protein of unknown function [Candidatus Lokiarchaeota archaeon]